MLIFLPEETRVVVSKPCLLGLVKEKGQAEGTSELEGLDGSLVSWPVTVGHDGVGMDGCSVCCSLVWC